MKAINGIIESADIELSGGFLLEMKLGMKLAGGRVVCFGGTCLCNYQNEEDNANGGNYAGMYICKVLDICNASSVKELVGKPVRVIFENEGRCGDLAIGLQGFLDYRKCYIPSREYDKAELEKLMWED